MNYTNLGRSGLRVSRLCMGCMSFGSREWRKWLLSEEEAQPFFKKAFEAGINFFDTADMYSGGLSEEITGRAIRKYGKRDEIVLATKVFFPMGKGPNEGGLSRKHILSAIDASLTRLGLDYVDLYQIHRWDYRTPIVETLEALHDVVKSGKARYIGASSMFAYQFANALRIAEARGYTKFISMQNQYNLVYREEEREMLPLCKEEGIGVIPWSPLARGFLSGTRAKEGFGETERAKTDDLAQHDYYSDADFAVVDRLKEVASKRGVKPAQIAHAWLQHKDVITAPIVGSSKLVHLEDAIAALDIRLDASEIAALEQPYVPHAVIGHK
jgi:aryl-alcohol dehydrogenase (NADP+)